MGTRNLKISRWKEATEMIYSFPSLWLGEDGRVERAGKRWKAMKSVPEWALGFALFQMSILLGDQNLLAGCPSIY